MQPQSTEKLKMQMTTEKALTRKQIYDLLLDLKRDGEPEGGWLNAQELEGMLLHFAPKPAKKAKTAMEWLSKVVAEYRDLRSALKYIYCDGEFAFASDGKRAHRVPANGMTEGYYCPKTHLKITYFDGKYPDMSRIFDRATKVAVVSTLADCEGYHLTPDGKYMTYELKDGTCVNKRYMDEATNVDKSVKITTSQMMAHGESEFGTFVVMGIRT